ncbi:MAG: hypothetical protein KDD58_12170 [Bdellovibrionales bacterium]|nr:hypothetical protein [Bdellovibrionales bacterium]
MTKKILILVFLGQITLIACKSTESLDLAENPHENSIVDGHDITPVLLLKNMDDQELEAVTEACPADSHKEDCVVICHIPPGNPTKSKTLLIPHSALNAHIHHGSDKHRHHDFVGGCDQLPELEIDHSHPGCNEKNNDKNPHCSNINDDDNNNSGETEEENDNTSNNDDSKTDDQPLYCDPITERDLDCDGIDDESGTPLY